MTEDGTTRVGGRAIRLRLERLDSTTWCVTGEDGVSHLARATARAGTRWIHLDGQTLAVRAGDAAADGGTGRRTGRRAAHKDTLEVPIPGAVTRVAVREGDIVVAGQPIVVVEAMKMEHVIRAPHGGRVVALRVRQGEQVDAGAVVAELRPVETPGADGERG
ncbi:MAG TPA: biotin/lipoyl-containing protein [bacterium]|nr:biotin/lipoyl-containing protein [bacterium]